MAETPPGVLNEQEVGEPGTGSSTEEPIGGADGERGRGQGVGGANGKAQPMGGANGVRGATGSIQPMGGGPRANQPMGGATGANQPMGGGHGANQPMGGGPGASQPMGGGPGAVQPMGGAQWSPDLHPPLSCHRLRCPSPALEGESPTGWPCPSCTFLNVGPAVLCAVCDRPRLAPRPTQQIDSPQPHTPPSWPLSRYGALSQHGALWRYGAVSYGALSRYEDEELKRQQRLKTDGMKMVQIMREAESQRVPVEAVFRLAAADVGGAKGAVLRARARLGAELRALMTSSTCDASGHAQQEVAAAWIRAKGSPALALQCMMGERRRKLRTLLSLGFPRPIAEPVLHHVGWSLRRALQEVQHRKLRPFLFRLWEPEEPPIDFHHGDQQVLARRALATLSLPSWGRAVLLVAMGKELGLNPGPASWSGLQALALARRALATLSLPSWGRAVLLVAMGKELGLNPGPASWSGLQALVDAVRSCPDRALIRRRLACECAVCGWALPREQMRWLTGCECSLCPDCFRQHFTIGVKEKAVSELGCPACGRPDMKDEAARLCYFSTLDVQLRQELDPQTYQLFTQKLTERELLRDPQFMWCPKCSMGFIFEAERGPAQCPQCKHSCCPRCLRHWLPAHGSMSCSEFGQWLQQQDPQLDPQRDPQVGLEGFLRDHGIECPSCLHVFAVARGGCLHFQCSQCGHHFCGGCGETFSRDRCSLPRCTLRPSLHAHHPRHCAFHLRDWDIARLQRLLQVGGVSYDTEPPPGVTPPPGGGCWLEELKEPPGAPPHDAPCGRPTDVGQAGLCRAHYSEYLISVVWSVGVDPLRLYGCSELLLAAQRHLPAGRPPKEQHESEAQYTQRLRKLLQSQAPVRPRPRKRSPAHPICIFNERTRDEGGAV